MGHNLSRLLLLHEDNRDNFSSYQGRKILRVLTKTEFLHSVDLPSYLLVLTSYQYNSFLSNGPPPGVARTHKINASTPVADGYFQLLLSLFWNNQVLSLYRGATQNLLFYKIME
jgi:hypothetical protein